MSTGLAAIASIIRNNSLEHFRSLTEEHFTEDEAEAFEFLSSHYRRYGEFPEVTTFEEEIGELPDTPEAVQYYIDELHKRHIFNAIRPIFGDLRESLVEMDFDAIREKIGDISVHLRSGTSDNDISSLRDASRDAILAYEDRHDRAISGVRVGVPTGWDHLDTLTGGYQNGDLITWAARPEMGKTYMMLNSMYKAWDEGYSVLFISMEMPIVQITNRLIGIHTGVNPEYIRKGALSVFGKRRVLAGANDLNDRTTFHIVSGNMGKDVSEVDHLIQEFGPDMVYIDGAYLLRPSSRYRSNRYEAVSYVMDELKEITLLRNRPIAITMQHNRQAGAKGKQASLETLAYSDAISTHSSLVATILPLPKQTGVKPWQYRVVEFMKGREGETAKFAINYKFSPVTFAHAPGLQLESNRGKRQFEDNPHVNLDWMG